jgi:N-acetylglutamate synthase-like GNAT family acetyltransferase
MTLQAPSYRRAREDDYDGILRVLEFANFHRIPCPEMPGFEVERCFVAEVEGLVVGAAGFTVLEDGRGKTTLLSVDPDVRRFGIGRVLQEMRMRELAGRGCPSIVTNADLPETIAWYKKHFGYREVGRIPKLHEFGSPEFEEWTTLEADLRPWRG